MPADEELLASWRGGDAGAGRELFERHIDALSRFFRSKVGDAREDLIQATFLSCVESRDRVRDGTKFRAYLFRIGRNKLYDYLLAAKRGVERPDPLTHSVLDLGVSPSSVVAAGQREQQLVAALQTIPLELQILIELHYWEGMSTADLSEVLEVPRGTVKTRLFRARALVRSALARVQRRPASELDDADLAGWLASVRAGRSPT
ncbi:MAG: RNA polymerase sigma factor [Nannocystaceae bacterium]|nr:RNA polymerase sigma factor [Nannocystaceae bacterium]